MNEDEPPKPRSPFGRPPGTDPAKLTAARLEGEKQLEGLPEMSQYLKDSEVMPEWDCGQCETKGIPCAQGNCPHCDNKRPFEWRDPEQGEATPDNKIGDWRKKARGEQVRIDPQDEEEI